MKVLLVTGAPIRKNSNIGKTIEMMFKQFNRDDLISLYFNSGIPNFSVCKSYYQVSDKQLIKSIFGLNKNQCGGIVIENIKNIDEEMIDTYNPKSVTKHKNSIILRIARDVLWSISCWKNSNLKKWLDQEKPDVIFTIMHDMNATTISVKWIAEYLNIPVIMFVTDDYYNDYTGSNNFIRKWYFDRRKKVNKELSKNMKALVGCSDKATKYFAEELNVQLSDTIYTPSNKMYLDLPLKKVSNNKLITFRFFGNVSLERWKTLRMLGEVIQRINNKEQKAILEVYSNETDQNIISQLTIENGCTYKGWVSGDEYINLLQDADIAVHVESFTEEMIKRTWCSISTKIADYLGAGKCILAIGSRELASIEHLNNVGCVVNDLDLLEENVKNMIADKELRSVYQEKARNLAIISHNEFLIGDKISKIINNVVSD